MSKITASRSDAKARMCVNVYILKANAAGFFFCFVFLAQCLHDVTLLAVAQRRNRESDLISFIITDDT